MSPNLSRFYKELNDYLKNGGEKPVWFVMNSGLCYNLETWCNFNYLSSEKLLLEKEMKKQFSSAGVNRNFPFSSDSEYFKEQNEFRIYKNQWRLKWIEKYANWD
jgi:hypothetical protein